MPTHLSFISRVSPLLNAIESFCFPAMNLLTFIFGYLLAACLLMALWPYSGYWMIPAIIWVMGIVILQFLFILIVRAFDEDATVYCLLVREGCDMTFQTFIWPIAMPVTLIMPQPL